jgi:hypothetical protein
LEYQGEVSTVQELQTAPSTLAYSWTEKHRLATQPQTAKEALQGLVDLGKELGMTGPTDLSTNLDDYEYGNKK